MKEKSILLSPHNRWIPILQKEISFFKMGFHGEEEIHEEQQKGGNRILSAYGA